jgi:hypothetical protein
VKNKRAPLSLLLKDAFAFMGCIMRPSGTLVNPFFHLFSAPGGGAAAYALKFSEFSVFLLTQAAERSILPK